VKTILVVDDEPDFRLLMSANFKQKFDADVYVAKSGSQAIAYIKSVMLDLIVADLNMPNGTGLDILEYLQTQHLHIPFALFTCERQVKLSSDKYDQFIGVVNKTELPMLMRKVHDQLGWEYKTQTIQH